jgi:hypothetical protein
MSDNLKLWNEVSETDLQYTKPAEKGKYKFTSITPMSQFKKATEQFGIQGIGWGVVIGSEVFNEKTVGTSILLDYDAILFFIYEGQRGEIPIHATEKLGYQTQGYQGKEGYFKIDEEVRKKVVTNAKTKGLSELGFNADIFLGMFDDPNYVEHIGYSQSLDKAEDRQVEVKNKTEELNEWCRAEISTYTALKSKRTLDLVFVQHKAKLQGRCRLLELDENAYLKQFNAAYEKQLAVIKAAQKAKEEKANPKKEIKK